MREIENNVSRVFADRDIDRLIEDFGVFESIDESSDILYIGIGLNDQLGGYKIPIDNSNRTPEYYYTKHGAKCKIIVDKFMKLIADQGREFLNPIFINYLKKDLLDSEITLFVDKKDCLTIELGDNNQPTKSLIVQDNSLHPIFESSLSQKSLEDTIGTLKIHHEMLNELKSTLRIGDIYMKLLPITYLFYQERILVYLTILGFGDRGSNFRKILVDFKKKLEFIGFNLFKVQTNFLSFLLKEEALKSAISAIMARNMSHNIGSHILSTLGKEGIHAADDRILFQYLQQRMDYIAQISTEVPSWTSSVWFFSDMMKRFYMQRLLLEYIGKSEGLSADNWTPSDDKKKVIIKIKNSGTEQFLISGDENETQTLDDFQLAIPGGIVGLQAFYTILENIIRNAAKHCTSEQKSENLEIIIELENDPEKEFVTFVVFDSLSDANKPIQSNSEAKAITLIDYINKVLTADFIDKSGQLRRKNWGLGELRISAGYLAMKTFKEIGFHSTDENDDNKTVFVKAIPQKYNGVDRLAYQFNIPKPKELLIIGDKDLESQAKKVKKYSIYVEDKVSHRLYEHEIVVLFDNVICDHYEILENMPGRIIIVTEDNPGKILDNISDKLGLDPKIIKRKIAVLKFKEYQEMKKPDEKDWEENFKIDLYKTWIEHLDLKGQSMFINLAEDDKAQRSEYLDKQLYELLKKHARESDFLEKEIPSNLTDRDKIIESYGKKFSELDWQQFEKFISKKMGLGLEKETLVRGKLEAKKNILEHLIFNSDEEISTVPKKLKTQNPIKAGHRINWIDIFGQLFPHDESPIFAQTLRGMNNATICYGRHIDLNDFRRIARPDSTEASHYVESLSGSQFYFTMLYDSLTNPGQSRHRKKKTILQLIENALLRYIIVDERVARFVSGRESVWKKFEFQKLTVPFRVHFNGYGNVPLTDDFGNSTFTEDHLAGHDVFIIHQGVLDKMGLKSEQEAQAFLDNIKKSIPFVFVTSGRGKPDNVPPNVKFIPFSSIDSFLLKEYPEKILLTQSILKLNLPIKKEFLNGTK